jgi:hypothetical protein
VTDQRICPDMMNVAACVRELEQHFSSQGYKIRILGAAPNVLVQVKKHGALRTATGSTAAMTAQFKKSEEGIVATLGAHEWLDKAAVERHLHSFPDLNYAEPSVENKAGNREPTHISRTTKMVPPTPR